MNAFQTLGLKDDADEAQVRQAYHQQVKACHPDQFEDQKQQQQAQEKLIQLNLAYEEALRKAAEQPAAASHTLSGEEAKRLAKKLLEQQRYESALLQLSHAETRDDEWYYIHGKLLMGMHQYNTAHQSFREAVRLQPENNEYRKGALDAAVAVKNQQKWTYRVSEWARHLIHTRNKT
ncbi:MAG: J domain-containing protein [Clostridia bacterium]|nr:J domain-containing protein [Clostridia bacterium]